VVHLICNNRNGMDKAKSAPARRFGRMPAA
jgi:hypothetical protein